MSDSEIFNLPQAHAYLGVSEKTLRNYCKAGKIPFHHEKNERGVMEYRFRRQDLDSLKQRRDSSTNHPKSKEKRRGVANVGIPKDSTNDGNSSMAMTPESDSRIATLYHEILLRQLQEENAFLKELLIEKEKQIAAKDRHIERQLERVSNLTESLATLANALLTKQTGA